MHSLLKRQARLVAACRNQGGAEPIHELRTCLRRLRVLLDVVAPWLGSKKARAWIQYTRTLSRATSRLRDLDVAIELHSAKRDSSAPTADLLRRRHRLWLRRRHDLTDPPAPPGSRRFKRLHRHKAALARRYERKLTRLRSKLLASAGNFDAMPVAKQHAFRRTARRLRYLHELGLARRKRADDPVCRALVDIQNAIGGMLDRTVCRSLLPAASLSSCPETQPPMDQALTRLVTALTRWQTGSA